MTMAAPQTYAATVARKSGSNFYLPFFSLPKDQRLAMTAVYAFCREVDDAVDNPAVKNPSGEIAGWREEIARTYAGQPSQPLTQSLAWAIDRFNLSRDYFDGILSGVEMDLSMTRYPTFKSLEGYCYHVAGEVGLLCMEIFGYRSERLKQYAVNMGMAFQLTNILRDVGEDARAGRIYLPQEDMRRFGVSEEWLNDRGRGGGRGRDKHDHALDHDLVFKNFQRLMAFEASRARGFYRDASVLPLPEERPDLRAAEMMRAIYADVLDRVEKRQFDVFSGRVRVPTPIKLWLMARTWWECL